MTDTIERPAGAKRRKRTPEEARREALDAARGLLLSDGPQAVTLARVGAAIGMSHTNLIHHFGSAGALHSDLMAAMVRDLAEKLDVLIQDVQTGAVAPLAIVDQVFDVYDKGGGGHLAAWIAMEREFDHLEPIGQAVTDLVGAIEGHFPALQDADIRIRSVVLLVAIAAFGDAVIGPQLRGMLDQKPDATRQILARMLPLFFLAG
jgi:TetR/AcrR family transcriptional regulator, repressor for neighboring sulfatase